ncbi:PhnD/SsuA/transferrin family substrate-binding protein [Rhodobacterales bacterium HKCCE2091]|nr:PhnD/SsuA/transferrin family substrate-binding protein [Rhodobacterales bacterium HKCCE2091]
MAQTLKTSLRDYPHTTAIKSGAMTLPEAEFDFVEVKPQIAAYRRMVRDHEFDVAELAPTTYVIARALGAPFVALPVFFSRRFHHAGLVVRPDAGIEGPKDLEGKRVGVRAYSVTTGVWTRGILQNDYGVDIDKVTWVVDDEEHVEAMELPANVEHVPEGQSLAGMIADGSIDAGFTANAGIGRQGKPTEGWNSTAPVLPDDLRELIPDAAAVEAEWYAKTGIYPMHSTLVVKEDALAANPDLGQQLFDLFSAAKDDYVATLANGAAPEGSAKHRKMAEVVGGDPLPYGLEANRPTIEALITYAHQQKLVGERYRAEDMFLAL